MSDGSKLEEVAHRLQSLRGVVFLNGKIKKSIKLNLLKMLLAQVVILENKKKNQIIK